MFYLISAYQPLVDNPLLALLLLVRHMMSTPSLKVQLAYTRVATCARRGPTGIWQGMQSFI